MLHLFFLFAVISFSDDVAAYEKMDNTNSVSPCRSELNLKLYFHKNHSDYNPSLSLNGERMEEFFEVFDSLRRQEGVRFDSLVVIRSSASPEGKISKNDALSLDRAKTARSLVKGRLPEEFTYKIKSVGEDWTTLSALLGESTLKGKDEARRIICNTPVYTFRNGEIVGGRKKAAMDMWGGKFWWVMDEHFFPQLRQATVTLNYSVLPPPTAEVQGVVQIGGQSEAQGVIQAGFQSRVQSGVQAEVQVGVPTGNNGVVQTGGQSRAQGAGSGGHQSEKMESGTAPELPITESQPTPSPDHSASTSRTIVVPSPSDGIEKFVATSEKVLSAETVSEGKPPIASETVDTTAVSGQVCKPLLAVKTNLLYDAATLLNLGIEVPIGRNFSIAADFAFPWWRVRSRDVTIQLLGGTLEGRYWFKSKRRPDMSASPLTGFFVGVHAGAGLFDFQLGKWTGGNGVQGEFYLMGGVSGGFAHRISPSLRMEYSIGFGYAQINHRDYISVKDTKFGDIKVLPYPWEVKRTSGLLPTKASVSLVWMISSKKGGERR